MTLNTMNGTLHLVTNVLRINAGKEGKIQWITHGWGETTHTLLPWRQGFRHPTRNKCMGRFTQIIPYSLEFIIITITVGDIQDIEVTSAVGSSPLDVVALT